MNDIDQILKLMTALGDEVRHLRQLIHLQRAEIEALRIYVLAGIADMKREERKTVFDAVAKITRAIYDENILKIEKDFPALAADIDVRSQLSEREQELWYLASEHFPKKDEPPNGGRKD